jgi:hypothetical protein
MAKNKYILDITVKKGSYNTFSPKDVDRYKLYDNLEELKKDITEVSKVCEINGLEKKENFTKGYTKTIDVYYISIPTKTEFFYPRKDRSDIEIENIILKIEKNVNGLKDSKDIDIAKVNEEAEEYYIEKYEQKQKDKNRVLVKYNHKDIIIEEYQGGFSNDLFKNEVLQKYIGSSPFGYIGSNLRTFETDKEVEKEYLEAIKKLKEEGVVFDSSKDIYNVLVNNFLCSSSGRHIFDEYDDSDVIEDMSVRVKDYFKKDFFEDMIVFNQEKEIKETSVKKTKNQKK